MKTTTLLAALIAALTIPSAMAGVVERAPAQEIERVPASQNNHNGYESQQDFIMPTIGVIGDHDDSVGSRTGNNIDIGNVTSPDAGVTPDKDLNPIDCMHPAYKPLCDDIKEQIGDSSGGAGSGQHVVVYNGSGTRSINVDGVYTTYRMIVKYYREEKVRYNVTGKWVTKELNGVFGQTANVVDDRNQKTCSVCTVQGNRECLRWGSFTSTAAITIPTRMTQSISVPSGKSHEVNERCHTVGIAAKNLVITRFEVVK